MIFYIYFAKYYCYKGRNIKYCVCEYTLQCYRGNLNTEVYTTRYGMFTTLMAINKRYFVFFYYISNPLRTLDEGLIMLTKNMCFEFMNYKT